jgi:hypothetical protein
MTTLIIGPILVAVAVFLFYAFGRRPNPSILKGIPASDSEISYTREPRESPRLRIERVDLIFMRHRWWAQVAVSAIVLAAALALMFFRSEDKEAQKWAFGTVGIILGFWLKN